MRRPLAILALVLLGAFGPTPLRAEPAGPARVVLVILGGGVRAVEMLERPDLCPTLAAIARRGFASDGWAAAGADPTSSTLGILTGRRVATTTPGSLRPTWPTLFECARKAGSGAPESAWYVSYVGGEALALASSDHRDYGEAFAPRRCASEGPLGEALAPALARWGRPNPTGERTWTWLRDLRRVGGAEPDPESRRLERTILEDVDRRAGEISGPAGPDVRALRSALTVLRLYRPRLLVVRLGQADEAARDLSAYWEVLRRDDAELGRLREAIAQDPDLAATTALLVAGDVGRDGAVSTSGGLGRGDGSPSQTTVAVLGEGPGWARGELPRAPRDLRDLAPTVGARLGVPMPHAEGRARAELLTKP